MRPKALFVSAAGYCLQLRTGTIGTGPALGLANKTTMLEDLPQCGLLYSLAFGVPKSPEPNYSATTKLRVSWDIQTETCRQDFLVGPGGGNLAGYARFLDAHALSTCFVHNPAL